MVLKSLVNFLLVVVLLPHLIDSRIAKSRRAKGRQQFNNEVPLIIAHRGDKALIPEHTIPAYDIAMLDNVDYVEPDLMLTKDQVLVCHHDITLKSGTDVASKPEFAAMMRRNITLFLDGKNKTIIDDWLIPDFTYAQLKTLTVYQAQTGVRPQDFNGYFRIPTFQEYIDAVHKDTWRRRTLKPEETFVMGMIPELKHPDHFNELFHTDHLMEIIFLTELRKNGYLDDPPTCAYNGTNIPCSPLVVQCFDIKTINHLSVTTDLRLLTLLDVQNLRYLTYKGMAELEGKTEYVGIWKEHLFTGTQAEVDYDGTIYDPDEIERLGGFVGPEDLVDYAHGMGIKVGIYTIYQSYEPTRRGCAKQCLNDTKEVELKYYFDAGVDAFFVEGICESLQIRDKYFRGGDSGSGRLEGTIFSLIIAILLMRF